MSEQSQEIGELAAALAVAQGEITGALKDSANPFFKSKYADLASVWDACRTSLSKNGLAVMQVASTGDNGAAVVTTTLAHKSGQWIRGTLALMPVKSDPQGMGSAYTYARRYALAAMVGVAQIDDDANAASGKGSEPEPQPQRFKHSPKPDTGRVDTKLANSYAKKVIDAITSNNSRAAKDLRDEINQDEALYTVVWGMMAAPLQDKWDILVRSEAA